jgi:outer membrane protein OmpA-like peptidoglycan-associated protein
MRRSTILSAAFLTAATPVLAQVTVDLHALQALPAHPVVAHALRPAQQAPAQQVGPNTQTVVTRVAPLATPVTLPPATQPALPESLPDTAIVAPIVPSAAPAGLPPPPPVISDKAATVAVPTTAGLRLTFAPGESDLSPDSSTSIKKMTETTPPTDATTFNVLAYAPGKPDDPSTARRISLSRAMAVRSALVADGVPSARIFVRALGEQYGDGPPDRVDLSVVGPVTTR